MDTVRELPLVVQLREKKGTRHQSSCTFVGAVLESVFTQRPSQIEQNRRVLQNNRYKAQYNTPNRSPRCDWGPRLIPVDLQMLCALATATLLLGQRIHRFRNH